MKNEILKLNSTEIVGSDGRWLSKLGKELFEKLSLGMTSFQIQQLVLNQREYPTPESRYWQCALECYQRLISTQEDHFELRKLRAKRKRLLVQLNRLRDKLEQTEDQLDAQEIEAEIELKEIEIDRSEFRERLLLKNAADRIREIREYSNRMKEEYPRMKFKDKESAEFEKWFRKGVVDERGRRILFPGGST